MKFLIVFVIGLLALTANSSPIAQDNSLDLPTSHQLEFGLQNGIVQKLIEIIQNLIKITQETLQKILAKIESILQGIGENIQKIIDESKAIIDGIANGAIEKLEDISKQNELSRQCVEKSRPDLDVAIAEHGLALEQCRENAVQQAQNIRNEIEVHIVAIRNNIDALEDVVSDCLESTDTPMKLVVCIIERTDDIKTQLLEIISNVKNAVATGPSRAVAIVGEARSCVRNSNVKFQEAVEEIITNVQQCIENGLPEPETKPVSGAKLFK